MEKFSPGTEGVVMLGCDSLEHRLGVMEKATQAFVGWFPNDTGRLVIWGWDIRKKGIRFGDWVILEANLLSW